MHVLVVQNYHNTGLGQVGTALNEANASIDLRSAYLGEALPISHDDHDAIVVLGGDQNALADEEYPYLPQLADLIKKFGDADKAVLGICLGSQLVARGYGATNILGRPAEFGWHDVICTAEAASDPVLSAVEERFPIFHWHSDTFTLPEQATHLALSQMTTNQAFRIGRAVYGIQFHFEADTRLVDEWKHVFHDQIVESYPDWLANYAGNVAKDGAAADAAGLALARAWVALIR
ncbi:type 1 glutamine amidotransferase [Hyphomicrobiales bacterium]|uniref:type 1 glutamine amidotransferase n=1 Tax=Phyllobacterium sp. 22552 TaxID=3453941 RepID=UPI000E0F92A0